MKAEQSAPKLPEASDEQAACEEIIAIATFMGAETRITQGPFTGKSYVEAKRNGSWIVARYDTSWDWLMPVVEKIGEIYKADTNPFKQVEWEKHQIFQCSIFRPIDFVYRAVVEFIKWYNANHTEKQAI